MKDRKFKRYIINTISLLKESAKRAKLDAENPKEGLKDYYNGVIMGYYSIITLLKHQAFALCIDQKELGLAEVKPDIDLLGLHRNPDIDFGEDNWAIETMNEERVERYLSNSILLLKEQASGAKLDADNPKKGEADYNAGYLMAYHEVIAILKNQAPIFGLEQKDICLADVDPKQDLT